MDAVEFLKAKIRMCSNMDNCTSCGLYKEHTDCDTRCFNHPDEAVAAVEKWAAEHPLCGKRPPVDGRTICEECFKKCLDNLNHADSKEQPNNGFRASIEAYWRGR